MPSAIVKGIQGQPGPISYFNGVTVGIFNELNYVIPDYIPGILNKFGNEQYALISEILGGSVVEQASTSTNTFSHFEKGRIFGSGIVNANVTGVSSGVTQTVTLKSPESYNNGATGTQSPFQLLQIVRFRSNGLKARVTAISRSSAGAYTLDLLPLGSYSLISGTTGTQITAGEGIEIVGNQLAGEASDTQGTLQSKKYRLDNTATVIRASVKASDLVGMNKTQIDMGGTNYEPGLAVKEMNVNMLYSIEDAVFEGVPYANTSDTGTIGVIPDVQSRGSEVDYVNGFFAVGDFQNMTNVFEANGGPREYHGLQHFSQRQEINKLLFGLYPNGAITYGSVGFSQEAAASYGFMSFSTDTYDFHFHRYKGFSAQAKYGYTPGATGDYRRNFGLFVPQGMTQDAKTNAVRPYMQFVYQQNPDITAGQRIYSWDLGFTRSTKTTKAENSYHQIAYVGSRTIAAEQFCILAGKQS